MLLSYTYGDRQQNIYIHCNWGFGFITRALFYSGNFFHSSRVFIGFFFKLKMVLETNKKKNVADSSFFTSAC